MALLILAWLNIKTDLETRPKSMPSTKDGWITNYSMNHGTLRLQAYILQNNQN